jgi:hypothetical protein
MIMPISINLPNWACSLKIDFPDDNIPFLMSESAWKEWGNELLLSESFNRNDIPSPEGYDKWEEWALAVFFVMQNSNASEDIND